MKIGISTLSTLLLWVLATHAIYAQATPEQVAPGIISNNREYCTTLTPDGKTMYFVRQFENGDAIMRTDLKDGTWSTPKKVNFTGVYEDTDPLLSPDGQTLYFMTNRNRDQNGSKKDYDLWAVEWKNGDWDTPYRLPDFINTSFTEGFPSVASNGTLYFFRANKAVRSDHDIWVSEKIGGGFDTPRKLKGNINTEEWDGHPFVDAGHEYLIFYSYKEGGFGSCDLYISFYQDGTWDNPKNLGNTINADTCEMVPFVTRDGNTLYFSRIENGHRNIYQVDFAQLKEKLRNN